MILRRASVLAFLGLVIVASCGGSGTPVAGVPASSDLPIPLLREDQRLLMISANGKVVDQCMIDHGFPGYHTYIPASLNKNQYSDAIPDLAILKISPKDSGYGLQKLILSEAKTDGPKYPLDDPYLKSLPQSELMRMTPVLWGTKIISIPSATGGFVKVRADGCAHEADVAVYPKGWEELDALRSGLLGSALSNTYANVNFAKSLNKWKKCISSAGFEVDGPKLLRDQIALKYRNKVINAEKVHQIEVSAAQADFECQKSSGYAKVAIPTLVSEMQKVIADHALELDQLRRIELVAVANAKKILGVSK